MRDWFNEICTETMVRRVRRAAVVFFCLGLCVGIGLAVDYRVAVVGGVATLFAWFQP